MTSRRAEARLRPPDAAGRWTAVLAAAASANLALGIWLFTREPARSADLVELARWSRAWAGGANPYANAAAGVDYPPWALVLMAPLAALGSGALRMAWMAINAGALGALAWTIAGYTREARDVRVRLALLCLSCAAAHTLGQTSALSFAFGVAGVLGPGGAGGATCLGLSLFKPHIGGIALVWALCERRWRLAAGALVVPALLLLVFCVRAGVTPPAAIAGYAHALAALHGDDLPFTGHTDLAAWIVLVAPQASGLSVDAALGGLLLLPLLVAAARGRAAGERDALARLAFCGVVSLLAVRHLSYDFIVLFPLVAAWRLWPWSADARPPAGRVAAGVLVGALVLEVPTLARWMAGAAPPPGLWRALMEGDRVLAAAVWVWLAITFVGSPPVRERPEPASFP